MKKTLHIILSSLLVFCSCGKQPVPAGSELTDWTFAAAPSAKAVIADGGAFSWNRGDQIKLWDSQSSRYVAFTDRVGRTPFDEKIPFDQAAISSIFDNGEDYQLQFAAKAFENLF